MRVILMLDRVWCDLSLCRFKGMSVDDFLGGGFLEGGEDGDVRDRTFGVTRGLIFETGYWSRR